MNQEQYRFTPRFHGERLEMKLSAEDKQKIGRGRGWNARVTDLNTGKVWVARAAACNIPNCLCDATVTPFIDWASKKGVVNAQIRG